MQFWQSGLDAIRMFSKVDHRSQEPYDQGFPSNTNVTLGVNEL